MQIKKFLSSFWLLLALCFSFEIKSVPSIKSYLAKRKAIAKEIASRVIKPLKIAKNAIVFCALDYQARPYGYTMEIILDASGNRLSQSNSIYEVLQKLSQAKNYYIEGIFIGEQGNPNPGPKEILNSVHIVVAPDLLSRKKRIFASIGQMAIKHRTTQCIYFYNDDEYKIPENILKSPNLVQVKILQRPVVSPLVSRPAEVVSQPIMIDVLHHAIKPDRGPESHVLGQESDSSDVMPEVVQLSGTGFDPNLPVITPAAEFVPATLTKQVSAPAVGPQPILADRTKGATMARHATVNYNPSVMHFNKHQNPDQVGKAITSIKPNVGDLASAYARGERVRLPERIHVADQSVKPTIATLRESVQKTIAEVRSPKPAVRGRPANKIYALGQGANQCSIFALAHALMDDLLVQSDIQNGDTANDILGTCFNAFEKYLNSNQSVTRVGNKITAADYLRPGGIDILEFNNFLAKSGLLKDKAIMPAMTEEMLAFILNEFFVGKNLMTSAYVPLNYETALGKMSNGYIEVINTTPGRSGDAIFKFKFHENRAGVSKGKSLQKFDDVLKHHFFTNASENEQQYLLKNVRLSLKRLFEGKKLVAIVYSQPRQHFYEISVDMNRGDWLVVRDSIHYAQNAFSRVGDDLRGELSRVLHRLRGNSAPSSKPKSATQISQAISTVKHEPDHTIQGSYGSKNTRSAYSPRNLAKPAPGSVDGRKDSYKIKISNEIAAKFMNTVGMEYTQGKYYSANFEAEFQPLIKKLSPCLQKIYASILGGAMFDQLLQQFEGSGRASVAYNKCQCPLCFRSKRDDSAIKMDQKAKFEKNPLSFISHGTDDAEQIGVTMMAIENYRSTGKLYSNNRDFSFKQALLLASQTNICWENNVKFDESGKQVNKVIANFKKGLNAHHDSRSNTGNGNLMRLCGILSAANTENQEITNTRILRSLNQVFCRVTHNNASNNGVFEHFENNLLDNLCNLICNPVKAYKPAVNGSSLKTASFTEAQIKASTIMKKIHEEFKGQINTINFQDLSICTFRKLAWEDVKNNTDVRCSCHINEVSSATFLDMGGGTMEAVDWLMLNCVNKFTDAQEAFKATLAMTCYLGWDTDTIGAIVGALLGAKFGMDMFPAGYLNKSNNNVLRFYQITKNLSQGNQSEKDKQVLDEILTYLKPR